MKSKFVLKSLAVVAGVLAACPAMAADAQQAAPAKPAVKLYAKTFGSWVYRCNDAGQQAVCQVEQEMGVSRDGHMVPIAMVAFSKPVGQDHYDISAVVPLGILLSAGVRFSADQREAVEKSVDFCERDGCVVLPQAAENLTSTFRSGKTGHLTFKFISGHPFTINFSLAGFNDAMKAFESGKLPPPVKG